MVQGIWQMAPAMVKRFMVQYSSKLLSEFLSQYQTSSPSNIVITVFVKCLTPSFQSGEEYTARMHQFGELKIALMLHFCESGPCFIKGSEATLLA